MNALISIVIPIYNASNYLEECLDSIIRQTYTNFEALLINDGSTDNSASIIDQFSNKDKRFFAFHKQNKGVSSARNFGIEKAKGEYICFVDADDLLSETYLESLYESISNGADSSIGGFQHLDNNNQKGIFVVPSRKNETLEESIKEFYNINNPDWQRYLWNRMYKIKIIKKNDIRFREDIFYKEDGLFVIQYLCASNGLVGCNDNIIYYYRQNPNSAMSTIKRGWNDKLITDLIAHKLIIKELKKKDIGVFTLSLAKKHLESAHSWVMSIMKRSQTINYHAKLKIELIMFQSLGMKDYFKWRGELIHKKMNG